MWGASEHGEEQRGKEKERESEADSFLTQH